MKNESNFVKDVLELHQKIGYEHPSEVTLGSLIRREFWMKAIDEEILELRDALSRDDAIGVADAIGDAVYVLLGASLAFGIPFEKVFQEIHKSNLTKDVISNDRGMEKKLVKGSSYCPPDIAAILVGCGYFTE